MKRVYKEDTPESTITRIRNILARMSTIPYESSWNNPYKGIYSLRLQTFDSEGSFGTNGKGRSQIFALASAYAEFIERIQNGYITGVNSVNRFFLKKIKEANGFYFFPDEKILSKEEFLSLPLGYLKDIFQDKSKNTITEGIDIYFCRLKENGFDGPIAVPFYDCKNKSIIYFPLNLTLTLSGSNGMAAGNSCAEGIFQGLCELIERNAAATVYYNQLTPPTIPEIFLKAHKKEFEIIEEIKSNGFSVIVKDFSCGKSFPAIGVLIIDEENKKYRLDIGCDTEFSVALSRALTEIHQGIPNKEAFQKVLLPIPFEEHDYFLNNTEEDLMKRALQLQKFTINASGAFPKSLFEQNKSYPFNPDVFSPQENYTKEVQYLIKTFLNSNQTVYIRDVSFLGFPSFYIYIPEVSLIGKKEALDHGHKNIAFHSYIEQDKIEELFFPFSSFVQDRSKIQKFLSIIIPDNSEDIKGARMCDVLRLDFKDESYWATIPVTYFVTLCYFILQNYASAKNYLSLFIEETNNLNQKYYLDVMRYFNLLSEGRGDDYILEQIPEEIVNNFSSPKVLFSQIDIPNCPNCENCDLSEDCLTKNRIETAGKIAQEMKNRAGLTQNYLEKFCI
jgi:YcaO-like protein with predicted kinase domain